MKKHAYLIMAHNDFFILEKLIELIDAPYNDIYLHIDKKVGNVDFSKFEKIVKHSKIYFTKRMNVKWSGYSQIACEFLLLKTAVKNNYSYYHLLSGVDLLIKPPKTIYDFFEKNQGKEFVAFQSFESISEEAIGRVKYYHLLNGYRRHKNKIVRVFSNIFYKNVLKIEKKLKINRIKKSKLEYRKGANWFSITDKLAKYVLTKEKEIQKTFNHTNCADEVFLQTIVYNSKFKDKVYRNFKDEHCDSLRHIDWNRGGPYTFRKEDYQELISSNNFFARKFSTKVDQEIIEMIYNKIKEQKNG